MNINEKAVNTLRCLGMDQITNAKSGHPGMVLSAAPIMYALFRDHIILDSKTPDFYNRDRFVMSCGHGSALLYSVLHTFGFNLSAADLKNFRKLHSRTPGHPERDLSIPIECTTGPLGQGVAMAVGMAIAEKYLGAVYNKSDLSLVNHYTYALVGDGDLMEGVSYEATELAGVHGLNKFIVLYDSNEHTIEGRTDIASLNATRARFDAAGFNVFEVAEGNDVEAISKAIGEAKKSQTKPSMIIVSTHIGYGSHVQDNIKSHGVPFTLEETKEVRAKLGITSIPFEVPSDVAKHCRAAIEGRSSKTKKAWDASAKQYKTKYAKEFNQLFGLKSFSAEECLKNINNTKDMATRDAGNLVLNYAGGINTNLLGGTADLAPATKAFLAGEKSFSVENPTGRNIHFGVREFGMATIANGIMLHGGLSTYASTFLVFADYLKPALRLAGIMKTPTSFIFSHDSLFVGEDGATHQPIEQIESMRALPNFKVYRPCDINETAVCYELMLNSTETPSAVVLSRQTLPFLDTPVDLAKRGGYVLSKETGQLNVVIIATGSEVSLAIKAKAELVKKGYGVRVVSMPCRELFNEQDAKYKQSVLPKGFDSCLVLEAASGEGWWKLVGRYAEVMSVNTYGISGSGEAVFEEYGYSVENVTKVAENLIKRNKTFVQSVV